MNTPIEDDNENDAKIAREWAAETVTNEGKAPRIVLKGDLLEAVAILTQAGVIDSLDEIELL